MKQLVLLVLISTVLAACMVMVPGHLYPVQGSLVRTDSCPGTHGTILNVEFYDPTPGQITNVRGIAKDNQGNIFKLTF